MNTPWKGPLRVGKALAMSGMCHVFVRDDEGIAARVDVRGDSPEDAARCTSYASYLVRAANAHEEMREALTAMVALMDSLWESVPWGQTFNLDIAALNEAPMKARAALARAEGEGE